MIKMCNIKEKPFYVTADDQWKWRPSIPNDEPNGTPMEELWDLLMSISEDEYAPNEVTHIEGVGSIMMLYNPVLDEKAPILSSTDPHPQDWKLNSEKDYEENFRSSRHCSYCDFTPCRCSKREEDGR